MPRGPTLNPPTLESMGDPLRPPLPKIRQMPEIDRPYGRDPEVELRKYVDECWVQQLFPIRTQCFRCRKDSPIVFVPLGVVLFGIPPRRDQRGQPDVTKATVAAFAKEGWKFQLRKSYCPECKNLGAI